MLPLQSAFAFMVFNVLQSNLYWANRMGNRMQRHLGMKSEGRIGSYFYFQSSYFCVSLPRTFHVITEMTLTE